MQLAQVKIEDVWQLSGKKAGFSSLGQLVSTFLPTFLIIGGIIFFIMVIMAGFAILRGAGSEDAQKKAKWHQILSAGAVGLIIMFSAYWILQIINYITGNSLNSIL